VACGMHLGQLKMGMAWDGTRTVDGDADGRLAWASSHCVTEFVMNCCCYFVLLYAQKRKRIMWSDEETRRLVDLYKQYGSR
jgi:hypothetical protein